jgi:ABC-2 type transport system permease protein
VRFVVIALVAAAVVALRLWLRRRQRQRASGSSSVEPTPSVARWWAGATAPLGDAGLVALREIRERVRGRIFRVGTLVILLGVGAAIVIPKVTSGGTSPPQRVGVVGTTGPTLGGVVTASGREAATGVRLVPEPSVAAAKTALLDGNIDLAVVDGERIIVNQAGGAKASSTTDTLAQALARNLGILRAYEQAGISSAQIGTVAHARPLPVENLQGGSTKGATQSTSVIGIVLLFVMLTQYNTWILMGVMQEKASRVVEVLLATVRPIQLLGGKVLGIGLVAMGQAALIVSFALVLGAVTGSDLLKGSAPLVLVSELLWLVLGYAFYCWVYAAAGSMAERQDQVQTLVLPLTIPILVGYVFAVTAASSGHASRFFEVLAYLPPTAPFAMPVLVGLGDVSVWGFIAAVVISVASTVALARAAAGIYRRAVLQSGQRVRLRDLTAGLRQREGAGAAG